jgi:hypothetical protein
MNGDIVNGSHESFPFNRSVAYARSGVYGADVCRIDTITSVDWLSISVIESKPFCSRVQKPR